jgi:hypothetical protein
MIVLTISLRAGQQLRCHDRFDVTETMDPGAVHRAWRLSCATRQPGEHVAVAVTVDGVPVGQWNADERWPRDSAATIANARNNLKETA